MFANKWRHVIQVQTTKFCVHCTFSFFSVCCMCRNCIKYEKSARITMSYAFKWVCMNATKMIFHSYSPSNINDVILLTNCIFYLRYYCVLLLSTTTIKCTNKWTKLVSPTTNGSKVFSKFQLEKTKKKKLSKQQRKDIFIELFNAVSKGKIGT